MKYLLLALFAVIFSGSVFSQETVQGGNKPTIDSLAIVDWPSLGDKPSISNDGNYFLYTVRNQPVGSSTLVVKSTDNSWKKEFKNCDNGSFSRDSRQLVFIEKNNLHFLMLGTESMSVIANVKAYKLFEGDKEEWLTYQLADSAKELIVHNLFDGKEQRFLSVVKYYFDSKANALLLETVTKRDVTLVNSLQWLTLIDGKSFKIWSSEVFLPNRATVDDLSFDSTGTQLVFMVRKEKEAHFVNTIWYYKNDMDKAIMLVHDHSPGIDSGLVLSNTTPRFSKNGQHIIFELQQLEIRKPNPDAVKVDVWSYQDAILQPNQSLEPQAFVATMGTKGNRVIRIEQEGDEVSDDYGDHIIVISQSKNASLQWLNQYTQQSYYLFSLSDGSRKLVNKGWLFSYSFSPDGNYLIYFDGEERNYFCYELASGKTRNLTKSIPTRLSDKTLDDQPLWREIGCTVGRGIAAWIREDGSFLVYDNYDIWRIDPRENGVPPADITGGFGQLHHINLKLASTDNIVSISERTPLLLTAFNTDNKYNGFYQVLLDKKVKLQLLAMGPYTMYHSRSQLSNIPYGYELKTLSPPLRALNANIWIVERMSAVDAPNYYLTKDFKTYEALTDLQPQKKYNWLTAELVSWRLFDGRTSQGVLYKPEDFDPRKKYPIIFNYYEKLSHRLYEFPEPEFTGANINIPWFVSRGYLVFTPDIYYTIGKTGQSVYNSVVSAAYYLLKMPYVDATKIGIDGHSFGGFETLYLITHSHLFSAAAEAGGGGDQIRTYGGTWGGGYKFLDKQSGLEHGQGRMGSSPWERPDVYINNSPVFKANDVTTPLLMMANKMDMSVPWEGGVEMFMALRRLGKRAWLLQYDGGGHTVWGRDAVDYNTRLTQFFDYYLKDALAPKWMVEGIPAKLKGIDDGLQLEPKGVEPGPGLNFGTALDLKNVK